MRHFSKTCLPHINFAQFLKKIDWFKLEESVLSRGVESNMQLLHDLRSKLGSTEELRSEIKEQILKLPNYVHPRVIGYGNKMKEVYRSTQEKQTEIKSLEFSEICKHQNNFRMEHLGCYTGHKSYYLLGRLAELEQSLVQYAIDVLKEKGFRVLSVPDILPKHVINGCGMQTEGVRAQVYHVESGRCLSGTAEMAIAGFLSNKILKECDLPLKYVAMSRCYRAETSSLNEEKGIYRVHQFTKVEMFAVCSQSQSEEMLESFKDLETNIFKELNLNFRLLDMPPTELGASAYQKYDIEAWMPGKRKWGEISSCSNCTDYQSKRLNIKYIANDGNLVFAHTVNGTASAIPRLLISLIESNQIDGSTVKLPKSLEKYIRNSLLVKEKCIPEIKLVKNVKQITNQN